MDRSWIIDSRGLAKKVINAGLPAACQIKDCGASMRCPNCHYLIDNSNNSHEWPGFPAGVKFDPSDVELLDHLAAKQGMGKSNPHLFIDEFIPTLEGEGGICCTHPENLPGAKRDGSSVHFFHRITNAYASGKRKRRRVQDQESTLNTRVRWHKTGKTKPVMENEIHKGFKKIMVLYETSKRGSKPDKCNWVQHQYHLGSDEDDKEGEFVVSKIFYQPEKESVKDEHPTLIKEESDVKAVSVIPMTPTTNTPDPPRQDHTPYSDCLSEELQSLLEEHPTLVKEESYVRAVSVIPMTPKTNTPDPPFQDQTPYSHCLSRDYFLRSLEQTEHLKEPYHASFGSRLEDDEFTTCLTEVVDLSRDDSLFCNEIIEPYDIYGDLRLENPFSAQVQSNINAVHKRDDSLFCNEIIEPSDIYGNLRPVNPCSTQVQSDINAMHEGDASGFGELVYLELDTPPDFNDLQFPSQDSVYD